MNKLQVELSKAKKRITKAVQKHIDCERVCVAHNEYSITAHAWRDDDIVASYHVSQPTTITQVVQHVHQERTSAYNEFY